MRSEELMKGQVRQSRLLRGKVPIWRWRTCGKELWTRRSFRFLARRKALSGGLSNATLVLPSSRRLGDRFLEHRLDVIKKKVALPVPAHFAGMDHQLEDMQVAVIRAGLPEQDKKRREEMRFIHNFGTLAPGGLNQDFSFAWLARAHTRWFLRAHFKILKFSAITNSHVFPGEGTGGPSVIWEFVWENRVWNLDDINEVKGIKVINKM